MEAVVIVVMTGTRRKLVFHLLTKSQKLFMKLQPKKATEKHGHVKVMEGSNTVALYCSVQRLWFGCVSLSILAQLQQENLLWSLHLSILIILSWHFQFTQI